MASDESKAESETVIQILFISPCDTDVASDVSEAESETVIQILCLSPLVILMWLVINGRLNLKL